MAFGSKSSAQNSSCLICARVVKFRSKRVKCVSWIFGSGLGFVKQSLSCLESLNFKIYCIA
nr:hypothetical protein [uncultured Campylobacter sp.]